MSYSPYSPARGGAEIPRFQPRPAPAGSEQWTKPWVQLRTFNFHPCLYPAMLGAVSPDARPGALVTVYDKNGKMFGSGLYNPKARVPLRVLRHGETPVGEEFIGQTLQRAMDLRLKQFQIGGDTDAWRVVNSDGDCLSGLIVDRYADVLSIEVHSLGIFQRLKGLIAQMHERLGTQRAIIDVDPRIARIEGINPASVPSNAVRTVRIREHGVKYEVDFSEGHKTGFFCDQRENRFKLSKLVQGRRMLDLCCYTGGFAVTAATLGGTEDVTGVDLDEKAIAQARRNGNLNQQNRIHWIHADAFAYARQMSQNGEKWGVVVLDPPKLVESQEEAQEGWRKYEDLNSLGIMLAEPGGLLVTCSCSGMVSMEEFEHTVTRAAHRLNRRLQYFDRTSAGPDHPVMSNCPESQYLKVLWAVVI